MKIFILSLLLFNVLPIYTTPKGNEESTLFKILKKGHLTVSVGANYEPYFIDNPKPDYPGFEVELAERYAEYLGVKLEKIVPLRNFSEHADALKKNKIDVAIGNSSSLPRLKFVYFSDPYISVTIGALVSKQIVPQESEGDIIINKTFRSVLDLKNITRISFGVKNRTSNYDYIKAIFAQHPINLYENDEIALDALKANKFNCYIADSLYIEGLVQKDKSLLSRYFPLTGQNVDKQLSFAFKKYDDAMVINANLFIREMKRTGEINRLKEKYFNSNKWVKD
jgi:polar amino acid transport system substrate-binding protein